MSKTDKELGESNKDSANSDAARIERICEWRHHKQTRERTRDDIKKRHMRLSINSVLGPAKGTQSSFATRSKQLHLFQHSAFRIAFEVRPKKTQTSVQKSE